MNRTQILTWKKSNSLIHLDDNREILVESLSDNWSDETCSEMNKVSQSVINILNCPEWRRNISDTDLHIFHTMIVKNISEGLRKNGNSELFPDIIMRDKKGKTDSYMGFDKKILSYCEFYKESFVKCLKKWLELYCSLHWGQEDFLRISDKDFSIVIQEVAQKIMYMFYVFWDNLDAVEFDSVLNNDNNNLSDIKDDIKNDYILLLQSKYGKMYDWQETVQPQILKMYKHVVADGRNEDWEFDKAIVAQKIKLHYMRCFVNIAEIFEHCYYSEDVDIQRLTNLQILIQNFFSDIKTLYDNKIAFFDEDIFITWKENTLSVIIDYFDKNKSDLFSKKIEDFKSDKIQSDMFNEFLKKSLNKPWNSEKQENWLQIFLDQIVQNRAHDIQKYSNMNYLTDISHIDIESVEMDEWYSVKPWDRRRIFFENFLEKSEDGWGYTLFKRYLSYIDWIENPWTQNWRKIDEYIKPYFVEQKASLAWEWDEEKWENYRETVVNQMDQCKEIFSRFDTTDDLFNQISNFIQNNKNSVDLLVWFFWFNLKHDFVEKNMEYKWSNWQRKFEKDYPKHWMMQSIFSDLKEEWVIWNTNDKTEKIKIFPYKELSNSSSWNSEKMFERFNQSYTSKPLKLDSYFFTHNETWSEHLLIHESNLYLPSNDCSDQKEIIDYVNEWLRICDSLLKWNTIQEDWFWYLNMLKTIWFNLHDIPAISVLKHFLKYVKNCHTSIWEMMKQAKVDQKVLESWKVWIEEMLWNQNQLVVWWEKKVSRIYKKVSRIYKKIMWKYMWDLRLVQDLTRGLVVFDTPMEASEWVAKVIQFLEDQEEVVQISLCEYTWNFTEKSPKASGYRDVNLSVKMNNGNTIELQFHYKEFLKFKKDWYILWEDFMSEGTDYQHLKFDQKEQEKIQHIVNSDDSIVLPENFWMLCQTGFFLFHWNVKTSKENLLSSDTLYNLARSCWWDNKLKQKIEKIESIWYDVAWGRTIAHEIFHTSE